MEHKYLSSTLAFAYKVYRISLEGSPYYSKTPISCSHIFLFPLLLLCALVRPQPNAYKNNVSNFMLFLGHSQKKANSGFTLTFY
jgi:hypothetical protein